MFNRVNELSKKSFVSTASQSQGDLDVGPLESSLTDEEAIQYVLASAAGIEHTTEDRTTTIEPGEDDAAYVLVSSRRLYFLVGDDPTDPELTVDLERLSDVDLRSALLSTTLVFSMPEESVRFVPADTEAAETATSYVSRIAGAWSNMFDSLEAADELLAEVRSAIEAGENPQEEIQRTRSLLSNAHHSATHHDDAPTELMQAEITPLEDELDRLRFGSRLDRARELVDDARSARESGEFEDGVAAVVEATELVRDVSEVLDDGDAPEVRDRLSTQANELDAVARELLSEAEHSCHRAIEAEETARAVTAWQDALDRYREAIAAGWDGPGETSEEALRFQLAWVVGNLVDELAARAAEHEAAGDEFDEDDSEAVEHYEEAREDLTRARDLAAEHPQVTVDALADRLDDVEEKIERAEWQWGTAD